MEEGLKTILFILLITIFSFFLIIFSVNSNNYIVYGENGNSTSDLQLMARAINRGGKRRIL